MKLYVITFGFSLFIPILLIDFTGLPGAVIGYLIVMTILLVLLVWEYASIRWELYRHPERVEETLAGEEAAARAYEESTAGARARRVSGVRNRRGESWDSHEARNRGVNQVRSTEASFSGGVRETNHERNPEDMRFSDERRPSEARIRAREERQARQAREEARVRRVRRAYDGVRNDRRNLNNLPTISQDKDGYTEIVASVDEDQNKS